MSIDPADFFRKKSIDLQQAECPHAGRLLMHYADRPWDEWQFECPACNLWLSPWHVIVLLLGERRRGEEGPR